MFVNRIQPPVRFCLDGTSPSSQVQLMMTMGMDPLAISTTPSHRRLISLWKCPALCSWVKKGAEGDRHDSDFSGVILKALLHQRLTCAAYHGGSRSRSRSRSSWDVKNGSKLPKFKAGDSSGHSNQCKGPNGMSLERPSRMNGKVFFFLFHFLLLVNTKKTKKTWTVSWRSDQLHLGWQPNGG